MSRTRPAWRIARQVALWVAVSSVAGLAIGLAVIYVIYMRRNQDPDQSADENEA